MKTAAIELKEVSILSQGMPILQDVTLSIDEGEFVGIFGPNGGGKTTLLKLLMGFLKPDHGSIRLFDQTPEKIRHRIGYVPQIHHIDPDFPITVRELIAMGLLSRRPYFGRLSKTVLEECENWMEQLGLLNHKDKAYGELSGGLAQRALLARALISDPDLILLDEPTAHIDASSMAIFLRTLEKFKNRKTILLVSHDLKTIMQHSARLLCVQNKVATLQPHEICDHFNNGLYHTASRFE
ncbi:MAG: zinc transporter ATP-binding protein [Parachlamydiales bacterium]|nr:zinc transporter ATP-binding protein [Parachlamydiales bacterium]